MSGKTISTSADKIAALRLQSSAYGATIPMLYGVCRAAGMLVWYGGFEAIPHTTSQGGKGGVKTQNTTYSYQASVLMALGHGRIIGIPRIWRGKKLYSGGVTGSQVATTTQSWVVPGSGPMVLTLTNAATFVALVQITSGGSYDSGTDTLQLGTDYTVAAGVVTVVREGWRGRTLDILYQYTSSAPALTALDELGLTFIPGEIGQAAWSGLSGFGAESIGYSGSALVAGADYDLGTGAQVENHNFEVVGPMAYHLGASLPDVDPSIMLRDILTDSRAGANFAGTRLDTWAAWSDYCVASGLLVSAYLDTQERAADIVQRAAQLTNTGPVWSGGRLRMVPYADSAVTGNGRTFTPNTTPVYALTDESWVPTEGGGAPLRVRIKAPSDRHNHIRVEYRDRANQYNLAIAEAKDQAEIDANGLRSADVLQAHWLCEASAARQCAQIELQRSLYVAREFETTLPWHYALLEPMDLITLTDTGLGLDTVPARVLVIEEGEDGDLAMTFEDYPAGTASAALYGAQAPSGFQPNYNAAPGSVDAPVIFEAPVGYSTTGLEVLVAVRGSGAEWGGCQVWSSLDGTNYRQVGVVYGGARYGTLSAAVTSGATSMGVQGLGSSQLLAGSAADAAKLQTLCYVGGSNPEYLAHQGATLTGPGAYTLSGLVRGGHGTAAAAHSNGDAFVRVDDAVVGSGALDLSMIGQQVHFKFCSFNRTGGGQQGLADVSAYTYTVAGTMAKLPPPDVADLAAVQLPAGVRINWSRPTDGDLAYTELREGASWGAGNPLHGTTPTRVDGGTYTTPWPAQGSYTIWAKHFDKLGNESVNAVSVGVTVDSGILITDKVIDDLSETVDATGAPGSSVVAGFWIGPSITTTADHQLDFTISGKHRETFFSAPATAEVEVWMVWSATYLGAETEIPNTRRKWMAPLGDPSGTSHFQIDMREPAYTPGAVTRYYQVKYTITFRDSSGNAMQCGKDHIAEANWRVVRRRR